MLKTKRKKERTKEKSMLHPRNRHRERYDLALLAITHPPLAPLLLINAHGDQSIDFADPEAVKVLNTALLIHYYDLVYWDIPEGYLCPPIPGRVDYIHHIADVLAECNDGVVPIGSNIRCIDIGTGANCVYPIVGRKEYGWTFVATDIDPVAVQTAEKIIAANPVLAGAIECRLQPKAQQKFSGIIQEGEVFDLTVCNPPFHASLKAAQEGTLRKLSNLQAEKITVPVLNFGGQNGELWCFGGEQKFVGDMIFESKQFSKSCCWFSTLISKQDNLKGVYDTLKKVGATEVKTIPMGQGNKISRIVVWSFLTKAEIETWKQSRWVKK
jgi:23S rRNA (adenine1618-N6)-methyltransferase